MMGGAEYLMVNTANLLKDAGMDVGVVDYSDGWVSSNINDASIKKEFIIKNEKIQLSEKDILKTTYLLNNVNVIVDVYLVKKQQKLLKP